MIAEILCVGTEILLGDIVNTNTQYISRELANQGITVYRQSVVGDNTLRLKNELSRAFETSNLVITTGGLGPTPDDLTKETAAEFFNLKMEMHEPSLERLKQYFKNTNREISPGNMKQAYFPKGAIILPNDHGTAPGCIICENGKTLIILPGPPREVYPMFENSVLPYLSKFQENTIVSKVLRLCGIGEGQMADVIADIIDDGTNPTVATYAKDWESTIRITAKAESSDKALELIAPVERSIRERLSQHIYGINDDTLEGVNSKYLIENNITISTAESCTGGLIASTLINCAGISSVFLEGAVTYSNKAKMNRLNVNEATLNKYGAVSFETAYEMAEGIAKTSCSDIGISTTGIAGPDGGTIDKPVGLVYIGIYIKGKTIVKKFNFSGNRKMIRQRATMYALDLLRRELNI
jgi:nicotinamide-nucleotide amidase